MGNPPSSWMASQMQPGCFRLVTEAVEETGRQETHRGGREAQAVTLGCVRVYRSCTA